MRKYKKVWESIIKYEKVWESMRKYEKVWESETKYVKTCESVLKVEKSMQLIAKWPLKISCAFSSWRWWGDGPKTFQVKLCCCKKDSKDNYQHFVRKFWLQENMFLQHTLVQGSQARGQLTACGPPDAFVRPANI